MPNMKKYNWLKIQKFHDAGNTWREIQKHFGVCQAAISLARKRGDFISRNHSDANKIAYKKGRGCKKHSEQTKRKISKARIKYLTENPDKVPYLINHSSKKSYPETIFEQALISSGITGWVYAYQNGMYEYDFAWPKQKIDVEIDGSTHNLPKVQKIDARRDKFSIDNGWIVVRFSADRVKKDIISCINELKALL
jgi:very-short-patch-repair endonuclease